jgi:release factor glutamine methyltransferase
MTEYDISHALKQHQQLVDSDSAVLDVQLILAHVLQKPTSYFFTWPQKVLDEEQQVLFEDLLQRRVKGEPVAYLLGYQDFWSLRLEVAKETLIPRPDTELLVELALALLPDGAYKALDLGTGTGAIALSLATERKDWQITATDFLPEVVALAESNRDRLQLKNVAVLTGSWFEPISDKAFDLILSNPPYIDPQDTHLQRADLKFEPLSALVSEGWGLRDIELIIEQAIDFLKPGGWLLLEHGYDQGDRVKRLMSQHKYTAVRTEKDLGDNDRVTLGCWKKSSNLSA